MSGTRRLRMESSCNTFSNLSLPGLLGEAGLGVALGCRAVVKSKEFAHLASFRFS